MSIFVVLFYLVIVLLGSYSYYSYWINVGKLTFNHRAVWLSYIAGMQGHFIYRF